MVVCISRLVVTVRPHRPLLPQPTRDGGRRRWVVRPPWSDGGWTSDHLGNKLPPDTWAVRSPIKSPKFPRGTPVQLSGRRDGARAALPQTRSVAGLVNTPTLSSPLSARRRSTLLGGGGGLTQFGVISRLAPPRGSGVEQTPGRISGSAGARVWCGRHPGTVAGRLWRVRKLVRPGRDGAGAKQGGSDWAGTVNSSQFITIL